MLLHRLFDVEDEQREQLYHMSVSSITGFLFLTFAIGYLLYGEIETSALKYGIILHLLVLLFRTLIIYLYPFPFFKENYRWVSLFTLGVFLSGTIWSVSILILFPSISIGYQYMFYAVVIGLSGIALSSLSFVLITYLLFMIPLMVPLIFWLFLQDEKIHYIGAVLYSIGMFYYIITAVKMYLNHKKMIAQTKELKRSKHKSEEIQQRLNLAFEGNRDAVWDWNFITQVLYVSSRWSDIIGSTSYDIPNSLKGWKKCVHPHDFKNLMLKIMRIRKERLAYIDDIHRVKHKEGHWIWIHMQGKTQFDKEGKIIRMTGTHSDITHERNLFLKNKQLAQIIEQTNDSIISTDLDGYVTSWNGGSEILFGYKYAEIIDKHISLIYPKNSLEKFSVIIKTLIKTEKYTNDIHFKTKSGEIIPTSLSLSLLKGESGRPINMVAYINDISQRKKAEEELLLEKKNFKYQANHDSLTGLPNRAFFLEHLKEGMVKAKEKGLALFFIDLDNFKEINDSFGHGVGDMVLKEVTRKLQSLLGKKEILSRLGGDEFTIIMHTMVIKEDAALLAQKILTVLTEPILCDGHRLYISTSIGITCFPLDATTSQDLLKNADSAMYHAKKEGKNNFQFYTKEMTKEALEKMMLETSLRKAIENQEFVVYYQPQIDAKRDKIIGMEALIRWLHPDKGIIFPDAFIPLSESIGLIIEIDKWMMKTAMKQVVQWRNEGLDTGVLSLNLSVQQLKDKAFISYLKKILNETRCKAQWIELEVTESEIMENPTEAISILNTISNLGIKLAVDDFGTGYSSLAYLKKLPIHKLKIDKSFMDNIPFNEEDVVIAKAIIALAQNLHLMVLAEGVETLIQKDFLVKNGCDNIQGYLYSKPLTPEKMKSFFHTFKKDKEVM